MYKAVFSAVDVHCVSHTAYALATDRSWLEGGRRLEGPTVESRLGLTLLLLLLSGDLLWWGCSRCPRLLVLSATSVLCVCSCPRVLALTPSPLCPDPYALTVILSPSVSRLLFSTLCPHTFIPSPLHPRPRTLAFMPSPPYSQFHDLALMLAHSPSYSRPYACPLPHTLSLISSPLCPHLSACTHTLTSIPPLSCETMLCYDKLLCKYKLK